MKLGRLMAKCHKVMVLSAFCVLFLTTKAFGAQILAEDMSEEAVLYNPDIEENDIGVYETEEATDELCEILPESTENLGASNYTKLYEWDDETKTLTIKPDGTNTVVSTGFHYTCSYYQAEILILEEGITSVQGASSGEYGAFRGFRNIREIYIPSTLATLGADAFEDSTKIEYVYVAGGNHRFATDLFWPSRNNLLSVGPGARCAKKYNIEYDPSITVFPSGLCSGLFYLDTVNLQEGITEIGSAAFYRCFGITSVNLPSTLKVLNGFGGCTGLQKLIVPDSVETISQSAFYSCTNLEKVVINDNIKEINQSFTECPKLTAIGPIGSGNPIEIANITKIPDNAFWGTKSLKTVVLPDTVTEIGENAFYNCSALEEIVIPNSVRTIDSCAFSYCSSLKELSIPEGVTEIGYRILFGCTGLESISFPGTLAKVPDAICEGMSKLTKVTLGEGIKAVSDSAFKNCTSLKSLTIPESVDEIGYGICWGCSALEDIVLPSKLSKCDGCMLYNCSKLKSVKIPAMDSVMFCMFEGCTSLEKIEFSGPVSEVGNSAFSQCSSLTELIFPEGLAKIGSNSFSDCTNLTKVKLPSSVAYLESTSFKNCPKLTVDGYSGGVVEETLKSNNIKLYSLGQVITITFKIDNQKGSIMAPFLNVISVIPGHKLGTLPKVSAKPDYDFRGWYTTKTGGTQITVDTVFKDNAMVYSVFSKKGSNTPIPTAAPTPTPQLGELPFTDVQKNKWYFDAVKYVYNNNIMSGKSTTIFDPNGKCTRAEFVQVLYGSESKPSVGGIVPFTDVVAGKWYYPAIKWAYDAKISSGKNATCFGVNDNVTREQVAAFLMNYAKLKGINISARANLSSFSDAGDVSGWARESMSWANYNGIINGKGGGILDPKGNATRAEVAQMIMEFRRNLENK